MILEEFASDLVRLNGTWAGALVDISKDAHLAEEGRSNDLNVLKIIPGESDVFRVAIRIPLECAEGYWYPAGLHERPLMPDWKGTDTIGIVSSSPLGCLYDGDGRAMLGYATDWLVKDCQLQFGVSEEEMAFVILIQRKRAVAGEPLQLALADRGDTLSRTIAGLRQWQTKRVGKVGRNLPEAAKAPVYSTWYAYSQAIDASLIEADALVARDIGCRAVFIDDGWQKMANGRWYAGCGDWLPDAGKFPDFRAHVARLKALGMSVVVWVAPLLLGNKSDAFSHMAVYAPHHAPRLRANILDVRFREVRDFFVSSCLRVIEDYDLDGLKIDFLNDATVYVGTRGRGDINDVGEAMQQTLEQLCCSLEERGRADAIIEFRQPYVNTAVAAYANVVRAFDCPTDVVVGRRAIIDTRMTSSAVVHSDPLVWDRSGGAQAAARQILAGYFSVPQISMRLTELPSDQRVVINHVLAHWERTRDIVIHGELDGGLPSAGYPVVQCVDGAGNGVIGVYSDTIVDLDCSVFRQLTLLNATTKSKLVLRLSGAPAEVIVDVSDMVGARVRIASHRLDQGFWLVDVPPCGIAVLDIRRVDE
ncbi:glycoside hydrolase family 36 protein [Rhizobium sp. BR 314]|uniref:glycoside hydrolase family 36 protein n=1 Tax=Rhizobium sp. BR 314 TaxID=3040013 RepID=UPI0039BF0E0D